MGAVRETRKNIAVKAQLSNAAMRGVVVLV
jgi:hypothetical protein